VRDHWVSGTELGVTYEVDDTPGHWGVSRTSNVYWPAGKLMVSTVTPGLGWSGAGGVGSVLSRTASIVVNCAPEGAFKRSTFNVFVSMVSVAV